jgi:hypothetical protein
MAALPAVMSAWRFSSRALVSASAAAASRFDLRAAAFVPKRSHIQIFTRCDSGATTSGEIDETLRSGI